MVELTEKEKIVLELRSKGLTLEQIGKQINVTRERVRQIEWKAKKKTEYNERNNIHEKEN